MRRASFGALVLVALLCWASLVHANEIAGPSASAQATRSTTVRMATAEPGRAASASVAATLPTAPPADPPAWRSVVAVLLGAAVLAGVALGTGLLGREPKQQDDPPAS